MASKSLKVGQRVEVSGKDVRGVVAYVGITTFSPGSWIGVILDEPKGKNNGSIQGNSYFTCEKNHGMFVRPTQVTLLDEAGNPIPQEAPSSDEKPRSSRLSGFSAAGIQMSASTSAIRAAPTPKPTAIRRKSPVKTPIVRKQQPSMTSSAMSSSRISLLGSRSSLLGSRTQLASPGSEKPAASVSQIPRQHSTVEKQSSTDRPDSKRSNMSPPASSLTSKRSSFVETGFVETLRPQFTAGQSMTSPSPSLSNPEDKLIALQIQQENEELKAQVRDLNEKLDTLKQRRAEDKEMMRELEKIKTPFEQLQEFKQRIIEANSQLQRDLQRARQETKDAIEAKDRHAEEMSELAENVEMITLDKEMAEEKAETLQLELEQAKERCEELTLDLEILKTEMQNKINTDNSAGNNEDSKVSSTFEFKQLEQQNTRLRETLVRLRDLTAHDKHEIQKQNKELETKRSEVAELQRIKEKLSIRIDEMETQFVDLQEQVDAALGAEEMVEQLADKKLELEDKIKLLENEVAELEALEEVHEQLVESNHELELDMREELDMAHGAKREALREKEAAVETIVDRDQTIIKFRELVQKLNDQLLELREKSEVSTKSSKDNTIAETIDFKQMFAESKAYTRAIDLQLRQIDISQAQEHVRLLSAYMPETFMARGGDHDAILVILLISRLVFKSGIIVNQARERFPPLPSVDRAAILQGHDVNQFEFRSRLLYHVHNLQSVMHQFLFNLNSCTPETLLKVGASLPEMVAQEKVIDGVVGLMKANQMDENSSTDHLEKTVSFFNAMFSVLIGADSQMNESQLVRDCISAIGATCDAVGTDATMVQALISGGDETSDSGLLMQYVNQNVENIRQQVKLIKRRLPQDTLVTKCNLSTNTISNLRQIAENLGKLMQLLFSVAKQVLQLITVEGAAETTDMSITHTKLWEILSLQCESIYEQDDRGPSQNIRTVLSEANTDLSQLAQYLLDNEYEIMAASNNQEKVIAPIVQRAQFVKKQLEETKTLTATLENREAEIRQLKLAAKMKLNELSEMQIRKDLAEKKLSVLQHDYDLNTEKLQRKLEETLQMLKKKEKEYEETMDHLQSDIDSLESEKGALRDKLKIYSSKKGDLKSTTAFDITPSSPYIEQELQLLKKAFNQERSERLKLQAQDFQKILSKLEPIHIPKPRDRRIDDLDQKLTEIKHEWILSMVRGATFPTSNTKHANIYKMLKDQEVKQKTLQSEIQVKAAQVASDVLNEYLERKPHRASKGYFSQFPSVELTKAFKQQQ